MLADAISDLLGTIRPIKQRMRPMVSISNAIAKIDAVVHHTSHRRYGATIASGGVAKTSHIAQYFKRSPRTTYRRPELVSMGSIAKELFVDEAGGATGQLVRQRVVCERVCELALCGYSSTFSLSRLSSIK